MAIQVVPYEAGHVAAVKEFNQRLRSAGAEQFPISETPPAETSELGRECGIGFQHFLAVDGTGAVRGGYFIRTQPFSIRGTIQTVGHYTAPLSEGVVDKRYAAVGPLLLSHALKTQPLLFAMGMGGLRNALPRMLKAMGWEVREVPFFFRVLRGSSFFRHLGPLHTSGVKSLAANVLAASGIGHAGMWMLHRIRTRAYLDRGFQIALEDRFGGWADDIWHQARGEYSFSAVRDARTLQYTYPPAEGFRTIRLSQTGQARGWAELMHCQPRNVSFFGAMRVMALVDGVAPPSAIKSLILAAVEQARRENVDLIFSNQMHSDWTKGLQDCGFLPGPSNYLLALSKGLTKLLEPLAESIGRIHFNRGDGDGRVNLMK